jgi:hypothetical protein
VGSVDPETNRRIKIVLVVLLLGGAVAAYLRLRGDREEAVEQLVAERRRVEEDALAAMKTRGEGTEVARAGRVRIEAAQVPARFLAPLPASAEDFRAWDDRFPPRSLVEAKLCAGDEDMWTRFLVVVHGLARPQAGPAGASPAAEGLGRLVSYCSRPEICLRARAALSASEHLGVRQVLHHALAYCLAPEDRAAFIAVCRTAGAGADSACPREDATGARPASPDRPDPARDPDTYAREGWAEPEEMAGLSAVVRAEVLEALERCARAPDAREPWRQARCLRSLVALDRPRAAAAAQALSPAPGADAGTEVQDESLAELVRNLSRFPGADDLPRRLQAVGLLPSGPLPAGSGGAITAREVLERAGRVHSFDTETGKFPNEHDGLLAALAALAGPPLSAAVFEEQPPPDMEERSGRPYVLRGYLGGKRFTIEAEDLGDWYDVEAVLEMLQAMLRDQGIGLRLVPLPTGDQTASILVAEAAALERASAEGLLGLGEAGEGRARGKAFEDEVLRKIQSGELRLGEESE